MDRRRNEVGVILKELYVKSVAYGSLHILRRGRSTVRHARVYRGRGSQRSGIVRDGKSRNEVQGNEVQVKERGGKG